MIGLQGALTATEHFLLHKYFTEYIVCFWDAIFFNPSRVEVLPAVRFSDQKHININDMFHIIPFSLHGVSPFYSYSLMNMHLLHKCFNYSSGSCSIQTHLRVTGD